MWNLESMRLVHFFLLSKEEIRFGEVTGIFGPNGSGKSTLLDAVQIAMMGGNTRHIALNAQADENKSTRSIRGYCLGQYGETPDQRARDQALTYITLIWRNSETRQPISMGVCIHASADADTHEVLGRYLLRGTELSLGDHLETVDGQERPRNWPAFRVQLQERSRITGDDPLFPDSERYIRAALMALRGASGVPSMEAFTRAFRFALRMRFDRSVDGIVRHDVLEAKPTNIKKFREITESFRRLVELVRNIEAKINDGSQIEALFAKALAAARDAKVWEVLEQDVEVEVAMDAVNAATEALHKAQDHHEKQEETVVQTRANLLNATTEQARLRELRESHSAHSTHGALQSRLGQAASDARDKKGKVLQSMQFLARTLEKSSKEASLSDLAESLHEHAQILEKGVGEVDEMAADGFEAVLSPALKTADAAFQRSMQAGSALETEIDEVEALLRDARSGLERAQQGKPALSDHVQRLVNALEDEGVQAQPVCDLVRITNPVWQSSIESFLSSNLEALLIRDDQEGKAFSVYRGLRGKMAVYGVKLVVEGKQRIGGAPERGSIAELIDGSNAAAVAFLRRQFGACKQAEADGDALRGVHTLTPDGMLNKSGEIERLRPVSADKYRIGAAGASQRHLIQAEIDRLGMRRRDLKTRREAVGQIVQLLRLVGGSAATLQTFLAEWTAYVQAKATTQTLTAQLTDEADAEYVRLGELQQQADQLITTLNVQLGEELKKVGVTETQLKQCKELCENRDEVHRAKSAAAEEIRNHVDFDAEDAARRWDQTRQRYPGDYPAMQAHCAAQKRSSASQRDHAVNTGSPKMGAFLATYREHAAPSVMDDWRTMAEWMTDFLKKLRDTELLEQKARMDQAYEASQETFRTDVAIALNNNLDWLESTMQRLNGVLGTCPVFSNGERYKFVRTIKPQLRPLLEFIKNVATHGHTEDLLGGPGEFPEQFKELLKEKIDTGGASGPSPLDDYREFFEFDVEILREDPVTKASKLIGHLSKRLGPGSGGEHRAPLYVIAGAALSSAYRIDHGVADGMRLILLDEAFNKMDMNNIVATMQYFEGLGLQVFMASPGENQGILNAFLTRYYEILRDADNNALMLQGHDLTPEARDLARSDLVEFNPELIEEELAAMRAQRAARVAQVA
jgi:energy-coupling factor transporter ATP-binding protein EcfA2